MGNTTPTICNDCGERFVTSFAGGLGYDTLYCDSCAESTEVLFDRAMHKKLEENYIPWVERTVNKCKCGGSFTYDAAPRCPECHSVDIEEV